MPWVQKMLIDEDGLIKVKGRNQTDHNTIVLEISINGTCHPKTEKNTCWNIYAADQKWDAFANEINRRYSKAKAIICNASLDMDTKYKKWFQELEGAARKTIGKTTIKGHKEKKSAAIEQFNHEKNESMK